MEHDFIDSYLTCQSMEGRDWFQQLSEALNGLDCCGRY